VAFESFKLFLGALREFVTDEMDSEAKTKIIQKLVHKVRIKPDGVEIEYFIGERYFERELGAYPPGSRSIFLLKNLTVGASGENRTPMTLRSLDFESSASTNSATEALFGALRKMNLDDVHP
jgi:hypothetical protein